MSDSNVLFLSTAVKFEATVFLGMTRDFRVFNNSFGLPAPFEKFINKFCFFHAINFISLYLCFSYIFF